MNDSAPLGCEVGSPLLFLVRTSSDSSDSNENQSIREKNSYYRYLIDRYIRVSQQDGLQNVVSSSEVFFSP